MPSALIRKLENFAKLSEPDLRAVERLGEGARDHRGGEDLIRQGEAPECVFLMLDGWAGRYKSLPDGQRQIMAYMLPGDTCDVFNYLLKSMDHSICTLGPARVVAIPNDEFAALMAEHPAVARALYWALLVDAATTREWLLNVGQRSGLQRASHLFIELLWRMRSIGRADGDRFILPLTQADLADTMGLSPVYVNRMLQKMRGEKLIRLEARELTVLQPERMIALSAFTDNYLHYGERPASRMLEPA